MIKKLRLKFIVFNMVIVTIMLCIIFGMIYFFTKSNLEERSVSMMRTVSLISNTAPEPGVLENDEVRLPYFTLQVGADGELTATGGGYYDLTDTAFLKELADMAFATQKEYGVIDEYNLRYLKSENPFNRGVIFADISSEKETLRSLTNTCFLIGGISFIVFLIISILLSRWAVKPVDQAWKLQRQFVADASHELRTPLTVIVTNAEMLEKEPGRSKQDEDCISNIVTMSGRMKTLIGQMLELARADNMNSKLVTEKIDLSKVLDEEVMLFEPVFFESEKRLEANIEENIFINAEKEKMNQVAEILLDNANKYSPKGALTEVKLMRNRTGHCLLSVANEGEEIPKEELENIFRRFYRLDKARSASDSSGLGLSMAEVITKTYGGKIWAESKEGKNIFKIEFPLAKAES